MQSSQGQPSIKLSAPEVVASVRSLYSDELKPFGRVLLKRLRERAAAAVAVAQGLAVEAVDPETMPKIDPKRLRKVCQTCPQLRVEPEDGREFSVTLVGRPCSFLDVCSPHDLYPTEMWIDAAAYFKNLSTEDMYLPGGRYACARVLLGRGLPFIAGRSLGQICHIVQLALSQKRILGYREGQLVPYLHSDEWVKEQCAFHQQPICPKGGTTSLPLASWEEARECLRQVLDSECNPDLGVVTLSNVKRLFRTRFQLELSETALGHSRLFDLLHDVRFRDVCTVQAHRNGQLLVKRVKGPQQVPCHQLALWPGADSYEEELQFPGSGCIQTPPASTQGAPPGAWNAVFMGSVAYPRVPMDQMSAFPPSLSTLRNVEVDMGMDSCWQCLSAAPSPVASACSSPWSKPQEHLGQLDSCLKAGEEESSLSTDAPLLRDVCGSSSDDGESSLALQAEEIRAEEERVLSYALRASPEAWCVARDSTDYEHAVKNTFIDISPSTAASAKRRMRSVPRDMYSRKNV